MADSPEVSDIETTISDDDLSFAIGRSPISGQGTSEPAPASDSAPTPDAAPVAEASVPDPTAAAPAGETPKKWAGKYDSPEAMENAYREAESALGKERDTRGRLERILEGMASRQAQPAAQQAPREATKPTRDFVRLISQAALEAEGVTDDTVADAIVERVLAHPRATAAMVDAVMQVRQIQEETASLRDGFFKDNTHLADVPPWILEGVTNDIEKQYYGQGRNNGKTRAESVREIIADAAVAVGQLTGRTRQAAASGNQPPPAAATARTAARQLPSGVRSEGGSVSTGSKIAPSGQDAELAALFG
jgi:hypothetical protein